MSQRRWPGDAWISETPGEELLVRGGWGPTPTSARYPGPVPVEAAGGDPQATGARGRPDCRLTDPTMWFSLLYRDDAYFLYRRKSHIVGSRCSMLASVSNLAELLEVFRTTPPDPDVMSKMPEARPTPPAKMGRPREIQNPKDVKTTLEADDFQALQARADKEGISVREGIRRAVRAWVGDDRSA